MNQTIAVFIFYLVAHYLLAAAFLFAVVGIYEPLTNRRTPMALVQLLVILWPIYVFLYTIHIAALLIHNIRCNHGT